MNNEHFHFPRKAGTPPAEAAVSTLEEMELQMIQRAMENVTETFRPWLPNWE